MRRVTVPSDTVLRKAERGSASRANVCLYYRDLVNHDLQIYRSVRIQLIEIRSLIISQISQCLVMARSQSLASLRTTPLNDEATGFCTHPFPEAMRFSTTTVVRLECSLHKLTLLKVFAE